ncbi:p21-activated kinase 1 [Parelaphostrongylus tenuis]|uniref:P21-activated kinase 1 n=1 Tax=Parelaphostrongylus tenuis TaxID=148309 RepID=A0AAD5R754_PARTN|nr:p21-activated kinase 1 [Parelaphostrongylus tenuis]
MDDCSRGNDITQQKKRKLFLFINSPFNKEKLKVQTRHWRLADADYLVDVNAPIDLRRVVFVGGVPRPIRAVELAHIMDRLCGSVACAGIDTDVEYKYTKGAGRVAFINYNSYMKAITQRYAQLSHGEIEKRVCLES